MDPRRSAGCTESFLESEENQGLSEWGNEGVMEWKNGGMED